MYGLSGDDLQYHSSDPNTLLVIRFVPPLIGTITTVLGQNVVFAFERLDRFVRMADNSSENGHIPEHMGLRTVCNRVLPPVMFSWLVRWGNWIGLILWVHLVLLGFMTGLKSTFLTVLNPGGGAIEVSSETAKALVSLYAIHLTVLVYVFLSLWDITTGLKWDPTTIADQLALFHNSNVLPDFALLEEDTNTSSDLLRTSMYRLGYWQIKSSEGERVVYGIMRSGQYNKRDHPQPACTTNEHRSFCVCQ